MGLDIEKSEFSAAEYGRFKKQLNGNLQALAQLLKRPGFGAGETTLGAELEIYIVDQQGRPLFVNQALHAEVNDPQLALELNRYNLEYNLSPVSAKGAPFSQLENEILGALNTLQQAAGQYAGQVVPIGILPTLKRRHFGPHAMTDLPRFHALTRALSRMRGELFSVRINGPEPISLRSRDVTLEGANTSMQLHCRVAPERFAELFNAMQLATPVVLAIAGNSPFMLGQRLWHETRIPLIKHAIDGRTRDVREAHLPSRVSFGHGWVRQGAYELFAESVHLHEPILPICNGEDAMALVGAGELPSLYELRLHQGTVWPWNRPIFDDAGGGHLRIEMRALPAGPSPCDMMANAAFLVGLAEGMSQDMEARIPTMPFLAVEHNFYRAAEKGLMARLLWPDPEGHKPLVTLPACELAMSLLPLAEEGLRKMGVDESEITQYLGVIRQRIQNRMTGACWQLKTFKRLLNTEVRHRALTLMVKRYIEHVRNNQPVSSWMESR